MMRFLENGLGKNAKLVCLVGEVLKILRCKTRNCLRLGEVAPALDRLAIGLF